MSILALATEALPGTCLPSHHERGFAFRVPRSQRHAVADVIRSHGREIGFEVDHVGLLGKIRCTYRERNAEKVNVFLASTHMAGMSVEMIPDYQSRYGVEED